MELREQQNTDCHLVDTLRRCLEKSPAERASVEELLVHPYLRPVQQEQEVTRLCASCKATQRTRARLGYRRDRQGNTKIQKRVL